MKNERLRTNRQSRALHLYFQLLSDELNNAGYDVKKTLEHSVSIPWSPVRIKELIFRPIMEAQLGKTSTTELSTKDIDLLYDTLNRYLGENFGIHVPLPSEDNLINNSLLK
jgi:hypothetical protein